MNRSQDILTDDALVQHDGILIVITLPRHISHKQVTTQSQLTILGGITLSQDIALLHTLSLFADRTQVDGHVLVRTTELSNTIFFQSWFEANKLFVLSTIVKDTNGRSVNILYNAIALSGHHRT